jgi:hypothetical protein
LHSSPLNPRRPPGEHDCFNCEILMEFPSRFSNGSEGVD